MAEAPPHPALAALGQPTRWLRRRRRADLLAGQRRMQAAAGLLLPIEECLRHSREDREAIIRSLCVGTYLGDGRVLCRVLGQFKLVADARDLGVGAHLIADGFWEMWHTEVALDLLKPGMVAVDIGANLGYFSLLMASLVGPRGAVHAFEPNPAVAALLRETLAVNGYADRAHVHQMALGDRTGTARLFVPPRYPGGGHVMHDDTRAPGEEIAIRRFDDVPALADADYVKMDVEGAEHAVWRGMAGLIAQGRPLILVIEFTADRYADPAGFVDGLLAAGFALSLITHSDGVVPIDREALLGRSATEENLILARR